MIASVKRSVLEGRVKAPPSKSYTHRAIVAASLSGGESVVDNILSSGDTRATMTACEAIGAKITVEGSTAKIHSSGNPELPNDVINAENSGTTIRIMTAVTSLCPEGYVVLTGDDSLRRRPMQPLLDGLKQLGVECWSARLDGKPPVILKSGGMQGGSAAIKGDVSSQFVTAILMAAPKAKRDTELKVLGRLVSKPYVDATISVMDRFGCKVMAYDEQFNVPSGQSYASTSFTVPGDYSSASFMLAAAAITGGRVTVEGLDFQLPQADKRILDILKDLGAEVEVNESRGAATITGKGKLGGGEFDLNDSPDLLPVVGAAASVATDKIKIRGVGHARFKETDRISTLASELRKAGLTVLEAKDGLELEPPLEVKEFRADSHGDHRIFMAMVLVALAANRTCTISGAETAAISYPSFIEDIKSLGGRLGVNS